jgi:hypothetical protein
VEGALKALACAGPVAVLVAIAELRSRWHISPAPQCCSRWFMPGEGLRPQTGEYKALS